MTTEPAPQPGTAAAAAPSPGAAPTRGGLRGLAGKAWAQAQNRNAAYLMLNNVLGAATGLLFWLLIARITGLPPSEVGLGYAIIALGTVIGVVAKGGLDTALVRNVPNASRREANRIFQLALLIGCAVAILIACLLAALSFAGLTLTQVGPMGWLLVGAIGVLLVITWLQDAYFLADGDARHSFQRNVIFSTARLALPLVVVAFAFPEPVALTWALALAVSAIGAAVFTARLPRRDGESVPVPRFLRSAGRNISGSAAEFVPGLLLAPLVLALEGPQAAAYFGIAWTGASLLFLASSAISRSALAELVRRPADQHALVLRRGIRQHLVLVVPAAIAAALLSPLLLRVFGLDYATNGAGTLTILAASIIVVAPAYYYLAVLRAQERPTALVVYPLAMMAALGLLAPPLTARLGIEGVALAWFVSNCPFAVYAVWKLRHLARQTAPLTQPSNPTTAPLLPE